MKTKVILLCVLLPCVGCGLTSNERIEQMNTVVEVYRAQSDAIAANVDTIQKSIDDMQTMIADADISAEAKAEITEKMAEAIDIANAALAKKIEIDRGVANLQVTIDEALSRNATMSDELIVLAKMLQETAPMVPGALGLGIGLVGSVIGILGRVSAGRTKKASNGMVVALEPAIAKLTETDREKLRVKMPADSQKLINSVRHPS